MNQKNEIAELKEILRDHEERIKSNELTVNKIASLVLIVSESVTSLQILTTSLKSVTSTYMLYNEDEAIKERKHIDSVVDGVNNALKFLNWKIQTMVVLLGKRLDLDIEDFNDEFLALGKDMIEYKEDIDKLIKESHRPKPTDSS